LIDFGIKRKKAAVSVGFSALILGIPPALNINYFTNQDWVWDVGLILSGTFISFSVIKYGKEKFRNEIVNGSGSDVKIGKSYSLIIGYVVPIQAIILLS